MHLENNPTFCSFFFVNMNEYTHVFERLIACSAQLLPLQKIEWALGCLEQKMVVCSSYRLYGCTLPARGIVSLNGTLRIFV